MGPSRVLAVMVVLLYITAPVDPVMAERHSPALRGLASSATPALALTDARAQAAALLNTAKAQVAKIHQKAAKVCPCAPKSEGHCEHTCQNDGQCNKATGTCHCKAGFGGPGCTLQYDSSGGSAASLLTIIATPASGCESGFNEFFANLPSGLAGVKTAKGNSNNDAELARLIAAVTTPYAMVLSGEMVPGPDSSAEVIVHAMRSSGLTIAGGVVEEPSGASGPLCHMVKTKNFTLTYTPGHVRSWGQCVVCDQPSESFVIDVQKFRAAGLGTMKDKLSTGRLAVLQVFLRAERKKNVAVGACPIALRFRRLPRCSMKVALPDMQRGTLMYPLAVEFQVSRWHLLDGSTLDGCCCGNKKGDGNILLNVCKQIHYSLDFQEVTAALEKYGMDYTLNGGTHLSGLKFRRILPWDYDLDLLVYVNTWSQVDTIATKMMPQLKRSTLDGKKFDWSYSRTSPAATVFQIRRFVDIDLYIVIMNEKQPHRMSAKVNGYKNDAMLPYGLAKYQPNARDRQQRYFTSWRGVFEATNEQKAKTGFSLVASSAFMWYHGRWTRTFRYNYPMIVQKYGTAASLFHVTRAMASLQDMIGGSNYGTKALTRYSRFCAAKKYGSSGCLDGWVWFQDWENWHPKIPTV